MEVASCIQGCSCQAMHRSEQVQLTHAARSSPCKCPVVSVTLLAVFTHAHAGMQAKQALLLQMAGVM